LPDTDLHEKPDTDLHEKDAEAADVSLSPAASAKEPEPISPQHAVELSAAEPTVRPEGFEPAPFAVPAPFERTAAPASVAPHPVDPPAPDHPQPAVRAWPSLAIDPPLEPAPSPQAPLTAPFAVSQSEPAAAQPEPRDWRDLLRRAVSVALIAFAGWFVAVLLLIVAYRFINPPFSMLMAQQFLTGTSIDNRWVPIEDISPNLSRAVIVAEDGRFCQHFGVDFVETVNALRRSSTAYPRGASTITMQVAKNLFLVPAKSYLRKMVEIPLTFAIELVWPKQRILEVYLNIVEWGPGVFGAEAASRAHFGRPASGLSARQAAQLAAVLPNPIVRDAGRPGPRTARKASVIQSRAAASREASACVDVRR
jgi:monofunctional biosynthetic peptidoglycan transglycosylase